MNNENDNGVTIPATNMEQIACYEPLGEEAFKRFSPPVCIHIHSVRSRLADIDGISAKAVIDGLVHAKILWDDSPTFVKQVTFTQEKGKEEKTIITITDEKTI
jgi:Holliday junction resolvase RusA-like endonuclease